jgi:aminoglycoside phosphotransferase (APT) family kinase protein
MEDRATLEDGLRAFLARQLEADDVVLGDVRRHIEGFSWETWEMTARWRSGTGAQTRRLIARREPRAGLVGPYDATAQWKLAQALYPLAGIPVPEPLWLDPDGAATGRPLFFLEHVPGDVPAPWNTDTYFADEAARTRLGRRLIEILVAIHRVDLTRLPAGLRGEDDLDPSAEVRHWESVYRRDMAEPVPVLERGFGWLAAHADEVSGRRALVHGDFRIGNAIVSDGEVVAMLDWELAHVGDPVEDLANFASRLYRGRLKIPSGLLTLEQLLGAYAGEAGWEVSPAALRFWLVFGSVRSAVSFVTAARLFASGRTSDLRYAAFSRQLPYLLRHVMADLSSDG